MLEKLQDRATVGTEVEGVPAVASDQVSGMLKANAFFCAPPTPQVYGDGVWLYVCECVCVYWCVRVRLRTCIRR
jgi:hypothetical protein